MRVLLSLAFVVLAVHSCFAQQVFSANEAGETRNRTYDVIHYDIKVTLHDMTKSVDGIVTTTLAPLVPGLQTVVFDAANMNVSRVTDGKGNALRFNSTPIDLSIDLGRPYAYGEKVAVKIEYSCTPNNGLTFNNTDLKIPGKRPQIWSQGEDTTNHYWFPCYDYPNDKATCEVTATVNEKYTLLSNGTLVSVRDNKKNKTKTFHWKQDKPISSYLIMIAAGEYAILHDHVGKLPLEFYAYPDDTTNARASFRETASMIRFFNETIGVDYPWDKYAQIILQDHFGGMENVSATTLADGWAVPDARARIDNPSTSLIAHELAHQWFGDLVTCRNFRDMWLNESFASYYDPLYQRFSAGEDEFAYTMFQNQGAGIRVDTTRGRKPIVSNGSYGENVYPRGSAVLHMLRFILGDELYQRSIKRYLLKHAYEPVETNDLKMAIEEETGQNLQWFFDEWVYKAGHPVFSVRYTWDESAKRVMLSVRQTQTIDSLTGVFRMPVDVGITTPGGVATHTIEILTKDSTYALPSAGKPLLVIFDKGDKLIKELHFEKSFDEWKYQALNATDLVDRLVAVQTLAAKQTEGDVASVLANRMTKDPFWGVRREAVSLALPLAAKSDSLRNLLRSSITAASKDVKAEVRAVAVRGLQYYRGDDINTLLRSALLDSSYTVLSSALGSLVKVDSANALPTVRQYLRYPSHQDRVASSALGAYASLDSTNAVTAAAGDVGPEKETNLRFSAINVLRRYGRGRPEALEALKQGLHETVHAGIRFYSIQALGEVGDTSVIPALDRVAKDPDPQFSGAAKSAIEKIRKRGEQSRE